MAALIGLFYMRPPLVALSLEYQTGFLLLLSLPVACISWTVTHEEIFREPRDYCKDKSNNCGSLYLRKLFYLFTCEYCFSHYVTATLLLLTHFQMLYAGWRGYLIAEFALVWAANTFMSLFNRIRLDLKAENILIQQRARDAAGSDHTKRHDMAL
jgi:hypothetical protein